MRINTFRDMLTTNPAVYNTSLSSAVPGLGGVYRGVVPEGYSQEDNLFAANIAVDYEFFDTYGISFATGRAFNRNFRTDPTEAFIINETAVREYKFETPENALGKEINREGKIGRVVGVIKDINFTSLTTAISPLILEMREGQYNTLTIKMNSSDTQSTIEQLESKWNELFPDKAFEFNFLDDQIELQYSNYQTFGRIIRWFTFMAILISGLGVYGLILFVSKRRVKEIGIRKVLGASIPSLLILLCREFLVLIAIAFVLAIPFSYYLIQNWLDNFTYHTEIDFLTYFLSFILVILIVGCTIIFNALKAAMVNPVESIRVE
jgi:putative ABC transport system permease protein